MRGVYNKKENENVIKHSPFFQKESVQPFFAQQSSPVQAKMNNSASAEENEKRMNAPASQVVEKLSAPSNPPNSEKERDKKTIQKKCAACEKEEDEEGKGVVQKQEEGGDSSMNALDGNSPPPTSSNTTATTPPPTTPAAAVNEKATPTVTTASNKTTAKFIVEDSETPAAGQMKKSDFLASLKMEICTTVNVALAGTKYSSNNCPYIHAIFASLQNKSPQQIEQLLNRYESGTLQAASVGELIQIIKWKVFTSTKQWLQSKEIGSGNKEKTGNTRQSSSGILRKAESGGGQASQSPSGVMQSLGKGRALDSHSQSKMGTVLGNNFTNVEIHTDSHASSLAKNMGARAFTVGNHIAFANGEHKPGTLKGDALLAHELAHVIQQDGPSFDRNKDLTDNQSRDFEEEADNVAISTVLSLRGKKSPEALRKKKSKGKSGLQLQRCAAAAIPMAGGAAVAGTGFMEFLAALGLVGILTMESDSPRPRDSCHEEMAECMLTSMQDELGSVWGSSRCLWCAEVCRRDGGVWPSTAPSTRGSVRCDYWNFPKAP